jgi:hypothetical protein
MGFVNSIKMVLSAECLGKRRHTGNKVPGAGKGKCGIRNSECTRNHVGFRDALIIFLKRPIEGQ